MRLDRLEELICCFLLGLLLGGLFGCSDVPNLGSGGRGCSSLTTRRTRSTSN